MDREDKELLLNDLCARLPYGVIVHATVDGGGTLLGVYKGRVFTTCEDADKHNDYPIETVKPYLRSMSSMTSKEWLEYCDACVEDQESWTWAGKEYKFTPVTHREKFLNSHHFDYRGLIEKGIALEAPEGMYNIK